MPKFSFPAGSTGASVGIFIQASTATDGSGLTGLKFNSAGLTAYSMRQRTTATPITLATSTVGNPWVSGGLIEIDSTHCQGWYNFDIPNAVLGTGSPFASVHFRGATSMADLPLEIELTAWNNQDGVAGGLIALSSTGTLGSVSNVRGTATVILAGGTHTGVVIPVVQTASNVLNELGTGTMILAAGTHVGAIIPQVQTASNTINVTGTATVVLSTAVASAPTTAQVTAAVWALFGTGTVALTTAVAAAPTVAQITTGVWAGFGTGTVMLGTGTHVNAVIPTVNVVQTATVDNINANAMKRFFDLDAGTFSTSSAQSVVRQITTNAGGGSAPSVGDITTAVWAKYGTGTVALTTAVATPPTAAQIADAVGTSSQAESYRGTGAGGSINQMLYELIAHHGEATIVGTSKSLQKVDHATTAMTFALTTDTQGNPTAVTRAS